MDELEIFVTERHTHQLDHLLENMLKLKFPGVSIKEIDSAGGKIVINDTGKYSKGEIETFINEFKKQSPKQ